MKPIDPRLLRYARATRLFLMAVVGLGVVGAGLVIAQAMLIAEVVVGAFQHELAVAELRTPLLLLAAVAVGRAGVSWLTELAAHRASAAVKSELRGRLLERAGALGPGWLSGQRTGSLVALATRGVDALDDYFSRYLPQLGLAVVVPVAVLARIVTEDWVSAAIIVGTLPLIPVFMMLIGWVTQSQMDRQWRLLSRLSGHFLDRGFYRRIHFDDHGDDGGVEHVRRGARHLGGEHRLRVPRSTPDASAGGPWCVSAGADRPMKRGDRRTRSCHDGRCTTISFVGPPSVVVSRPCVRPA